MASSRGFVQGSAAGTVKQPKTKAICVAQNIERRATGFRSSAGRFATEAEMCHTDGLVELQAALTFVELEEVDCFVKIYREARSSRKRLSTVAKPPEQLAEPPQAMYPFSWDVDFQHRHCEIPCHGRKKVLQQL